VQGGTDLSQRHWCAERITAIDLPGYAIGGVAVGESTSDIERVVQFTAPLLPEGKPRYLMGVGYARDIVSAVRAGIDMFDCVLPTRNGRNATAFTASGPIKFRNAVHADDPGPIEAGCDCVACRWSLRESMYSVGVRNSSFDPRPCGAGAESGAQQDSTFSRAYIRHLFLSEEMLGPILLSLHNVRFYQRLMADLRSTISAAGLSPDPGAEKASVAGPWQAFRDRWPVAFADEPAASSSRVGT
jgi:queuine tRNA-ribosyltransferase